MITIRRLESADVDRLRDIDVSENGDVVYRVIDGQVVPTSEEWHRPRWSESECARRIARIRQQLTAGDVVLGALDAVRLVGLAVLHLSLSPGMSQLAGLWVTNTHWRQGVATRLCDEVERLAREAGSTAFYVSATPSRGAVGFYQSRGFRLTDDVDADLYELEPNDIHMVMQLGVRQFPLIDEREGIRMGANLVALAPGETLVVESPHRLQKEQSYGYIRALWWLWLADGRSAVSVPPGAGDRVERIVKTVREPAQLNDEGLAEQLRAPVNESLRQAGLEPVDRVFSDVCFASNEHLLLRHHHGDCRRLTDDSIPPAEGLGLPSHCFPDGISYGIVVAGEAVSIAFSHRPGVMEDRVADIGIETAEGHRRRGYGKTAVSAVAGHVIDVGGEARYACRPDNAASIAAARSCGFVDYARSLILSAPRRDREA